MRKVPSPGRALPDGVEGTAEDADEATDDDGNGGTVVPG
jgi:hypothetical protein